jgi:hypothetical protein
MKAIKDNKYLCSARVKVLTKNPIYGLEAKQKKALNNIKDIHKQLNEINKGFIQEKLQSSVFKMSTRKLVVKNNKASSISVSRQSSFDSLNGLTKKDVQLKEINDKNQDIFGIEPGFTQNVTKLVDDIMSNSAGILRSSLDFEHQKALMEKSNHKEGYQESKTLEKLKMEFVEHNELPD